MRALLLVVLVFLANSLLAQTVFCPEGARWIYYTPSSAAPPEEYHFVYTGDTLIGGFADVKVLTKQTRRAWSETEIEYFESRSFFKQSNDSILQFVDGEFKLMFDFGVQAGDKRVVGLDWNWGCAEQDTMLIDSLGIMSYQGQNLTTYYFSLLVEDQLDSLDGEMEAYTIGGGNGMYVERLGLMADHPTGLFLGCIDGNTIAEYVPASFVCYTDNQLAINYPDTCNRFVDTPEIHQQKAQVSVYQNHLQIKNAPNSTLRIYDILGKELFQTEVSSDYQSISLEHLPNGILFAVCESEYFRLVKKVLTSN